MTVPGREDTELIVRLLSSTGVVAVHGLLMPVERELVSHINVRLEPESPVGCGGL
jgi:hypothetical protein